MSWTASTPTPIDKQDTNEITGTPQTSPEGCGLAYLEQFEAAKEAVSILVSAIGRDNDQVTVSMSGHANPDHAPHEAFADETISITVSARPAKID